MRALREGRGGELPGLLQFDSMPTRFYGCVNTWGVWVRYDKLTTCYLQPFLFSQVRLWSLRSLVDIRAF